MQKTIVETTKTQSTGRAPIYRIQTGDGCWYRISEDDYHRLREANGVGCVQITVLPGRAYSLSDDLNVQRMQAEDPEILEARVAKAKAEIAALAEKLRKIQTLLTDAE